MKPITERHVQCKLGVQGHSFSLLVIIVLISLAVPFCFYLGPAAQGQEQPPPPPPPPRVIVTPAIPAPTPAPAPTPTIIFTPPVTPFTPPVVVPTDVTNPQITNPNVTKLPSDQMQNTTALALAGIQLLNDNNFPTPDKVGKNFDWITVLAKDGAVYSKPNNYTADLKSGDLIVSVKSPSHLAFVKTAFGDIAIGANGDVMITYNQGVLHLLNLDGEGKVLKVKLDKGPFAGPADPTVTIAPGYELIASEKPITRADMRPHDGIARRYGKTLENGHLAIGQFSVESAAKNIGMLVNLQQNTSGIKERRILSDLSKMAAVLNYRYGEIGYSVEK